MQFPAETPPGSSETHETLHLWNALILPVVFTIAAWAVDRFTRSALGDWRYVLVAVLGVCAIAFAAMAVVVAIAVNGDKIDEIDNVIARRTPRWLTGKSNAFLAVLIVAAVILEAVRAVRDDSVLDAVTAFVIVVWAAFIPGAYASATMPRCRRRAYRAAALLLPVWLLAVNFFRLR